MIYQQELHIYIGMEYKNYADPNINNNAKKMDDFYNSEAAAQMSAEYSTASSYSKQHITESIETAALLERQIKSMRSLLLYRKRIRLEIRLQRILLNILVSLPPTEQQLGTQVYNQLLDCVARLEKMC